MSTICLETVKYIMWKFMLEQGLTDSASKFLHESNLMTCPIVKQNPYTPRDALINLLVLAKSYAIQQFGEPVDSERMGLLDVASEIEEHEAGSETMTKNEDFEYSFDDNMMKFINFDTVNYIIWNFMLEHGHTQSAFTFLHESNLMTCPIVKQNPYTPRDALIKLLGKAGNYAMEMFGDSIDLESMGLLDAACKLEEDRGFNWMWTSKPRSANFFLEGEERQVFRHFGEGWSLDWHPSKNTILTTSRGKASMAYIQTLDATPDLWPKKASQVVSSTWKIGQEEEAELLCAKWSKKYVNQCATAHTGCELRLNNRKGETIATTVLDSEIQTLCWAPMNSEGPNYLACATQGGELYIYDCTLPSKGLTKAVQQFEGYTGIKEMHFLEPSPGHLVFHYKNRLFLHSAEKEYYLQQYLGHKETILGVRPCPGQNIFASGSADCTAKIWYVNQQTAIQSYEHEAPVLQTRWNPDAQSFLTLSKDWVVSIYDVEKKKKIATIHDVPGTSSEYSHDGSMFAMGCNEGMLYVWDIRTQDMIRYKDITKYRAPIVELGWSYDDQKIAAIYDDGSIYLFDMRM